MPKPKWFNDNLASMLLGKDNKQEETPSSHNEDQVLPSPSTPTDVVSTPPKSDKIVLPIKVPTTGNKRVSFPVYLPQDLNQRFQAAVAQDGQKKSALVKTWIMEYLRQREQYEN